MESIHKNDRTVNVFVAQAVDWWVEYRDALFWGFAVFLTVVCAVGALRLGLLMQQENSIVQIRGAYEIVPEDLHERYNSAASGLPGMVAASKNGIRYYYPWCGGLNRVKEENKVWFATTAAAERAGYTIAKGCKGL